jgi:hypothetical protein
MAKHGYTCKKCNELGGVAGTDEEIMKTTKDEREEFRRMICEALERRMICEALEESHRKCSEENECYVCPPPKCGTFPKPTCETLKRANARIAELEAEVKRLDEVIIRSSGCFSEKQIERR